MASFDFGVRRVDTKAVALFIQSPDRFIAAIMVSDEYVLEFSITGTPDLTRR